ncbi:MAG: hypothetical protein JXB88_04700 [Spirochaetales bacterium]|nr:hypothetical protein [Spirochaetales bacterium]
MNKITLFLFIIYSFLSTQIILPADHWVSTWVSGQQLTETSNLPPSPGLTNNTLRQIVHVSIGGNQLRVQFSNEYGNSAVTINSAHLADSSGGSSIDPATDRALTFQGGSSVTIQAGQTVFSDTLNYNVAPLSNLAVSIHFGATSSNITGHPGSRTTSYLQSGNAVTSTTLSSAATTDHWYILSRIDLLADDSCKAVVVLGDSITDGRGSTTNGNNRWPDNLARRLQADSNTNKVAVLNQGIGGNAVLSGGLGPTALSRFDRDVLGAPGVRWLIILEGVNDIGSSYSQTVATDLIAAYEQLITKAHTNNILVYGVPILPFGGSQYYSQAHEDARQTVNTWIRTSNKFDEVIDLDTAVRDPGNPVNLLSSYDSGDHLHLNVAGYQKMADSIDLQLFYDATSTPSPGIPGDVDGSGAIDIIDALLVARYYIGLNPSNFNPDLADVTRDGSIDSIDALRIAQCYVGLISCDF